VLRASSHSTREALSEAALELFYQQGVANTSLADIAGAAGVPTGNVYYHFRSKEALVEAVIDKRTQQPKTLFAEGIVNLTVLGLPNFNTYTLICEGIREAALYHCSGGLIFR